MSGRNRLPGGEVRKASQKRMRPAEVRTIRLEVPWQPGDRVRWRDRAGRPGADVSANQRPPPRPCVNVVAEARYLAYRSW